MPERYPQRGFTPPDGSTMLTLVRHGQSQAGDPENPFPLVDGHGNPPLTDLGHAQARAVGERLRAERVDAIYASSLVRTQETAAPLADHLALDVRIEPELREVFLGEWEGGVFRKMIHDATHPAVAEWRATGDWGAVPGAETNAELTERCARAVHRIHDAHRGHHVVAFVHGGVIAALLSVATRGVLAATAGADNGSIHRLCLTADQWILRGFNDCGHLDGVATPPR